MDSKEIRLKLNQLQAEKDAIESQIHEARRHAKVTGEYASNKWLTSAEHASRMRGREISKLQVSLSEAVRSEKALRSAENIAKSKAESSSFEREFMLQARQTLPRQMYEQLILQTLRATSEDQSTRATN